MSKLLERLSVAMKLGEAEEQVDVLARGNRRWTEQGELWGGQKPKHVVPTAKKAGSASSDFDFNSTEIARIARAATPQAKKTQAGVVRGLSQSGALKPEAIGRFFEVNHTVQSDRSLAYRVIRAARNCVSADYDLWKGPTRQVTFLLG